MKKIIILVSICFLIGGCFDYKELNDMSIVNGIAVDYQDNKYVVDLEINNSIKQNGDSLVATEIIEGINNNLALAYNEATQNSNKLLYAEHVNLLLLSEEVAEKGINEIIDFFLRDITINNNYMVVITKNPKDILKIKKNNTSIINVIVDTIKYDINTTYLNDLDLVAAKLLNEKVDLVLPYIEVENDNIIVNKIACFKKDKLKYIDDAKIYNFMIHKIDSTDFIYDNNVVNVYDQKIDYDIKKDKITIKITGNGRIKETDIGYNLKEVDDYNKIEYLINIKIEDEITKYLDNSFKREIDLLNLKDKYYKEFKRVKENIKYDVEAKITLNKNGSIYEVVYD